MVEFIVDTSVEEDAQGQCSEMSQRPKHSFFIFWEMYLML